MLFDEYEGRENVQNVELCFEILKDLSTSYA